LGEFSNVAVVRLAKLIRLLKKTFERDLFAKYHIHEGALTELVPQEFRHVRHLPCPGQPPPQFRFAHGSLQRDRVMALL
jgi:hypothetical protein